MVEDSVYMRIHVCECVCFMGRLKGFLCPQPFKVEYLDPIESE